MESYYKETREHINDELLLVDLMVNAQVLKYRSVKKSTNNMPGLYITEEQVDELLNRTPGYSRWVDETAPADEQCEALSAAVKALWQQINEKLKKTREKGTRLLLEELSRVCSLSTIEMQIFLICLAPAYDSKFESLFSYLQDDVTKKAPCVELILNLLCRTFNERAGTLLYFTAQSQLFKHNLLEFIPTPADPGKNLISKPLKVNQRIFNYLNGDERADDDVYTMVERVTTEQTLEDLALPRYIRERFRDFIKYCGSVKPENFVFSFFGPYGTEMQEVAAVLCKEIEAPFLVVDLQAVYQSGIYFERCIDLIFRESRLKCAALFFNNTDFLFDGSMDNNYSRRYFLDRMDENSILTFIASREMPPLHGEFKKQKLIALELPLPEYEQRKKLWSTQLADRQTDDKVDVKEIAGKYNLSTGQIRAVAETAGVYALWRDPAKPVIRGKDIEDATHLHSNQRLGRLAVRIRPIHRWDDLVLKPEIKEKLREFVKMFRHKHLVYSEWGFNKKLSLGKGISALFFGEPGTGKTLAGEILAAELGMDLYKIDISSIISKYIGETEKNLSRIFDEAESSNAILFFDEADAIFGKRTEVKDSHDRYSNIEVSYLLQRIDEYNGVVIMATNFSRNMDEAFRRRIHFSIKFPMPDEESRLVIWQNIFPSDVPTGDMDFALLARKLEIAGGHIKNIALQSAFYAADQEKDQCITMELVKKACRGEFKKMGLLWKDDIY